MSIVESKMATRGQWKEMYGVSHRERKADEALGRARSPGREFRAVEDKVIMDPVVAQRQDNTTGLRAA